MTQEQAVLSVFYDAPGEWIDRNTIYDRASRIWYFGGVNPQGKVDRALDTLVKKEKIERYGDRSGFYRLHEQNERQRLPGL